MNHRANLLWLRWGAQVSWLAALVIPCSAAETSGKPTIESYLRRIGYAAVPLARDDSNHLVAQAELNGRLRWMMVDSGWSYTTLDKSIARKFKTLGELGVTFEDSFLGRLTNSAIVLMNLQFGQVALTNQPALVKNLYARPRSFRDGLLGCDFLFRNFCLIDCLDRRLYLRNEAPSPEIRNVPSDSLRRSGFHELPLRRESGLALTCEAKVNGQPVRLLVDTGSVYSILDSAQVKRLGLRRLETPQKVVGVGKIGSHWLDVTRLKSFELGDLVLKNIDFGIVELEAWGVGEPERALHGTHGILGADQLMLTGALIDYQKVSLWLRPPKKER